MGTPVRILALEDSRGDVVLMKFHLEEAGLDFVLENVMTRVGFEKALIEFAPDIILADYTLPDYDGISALETARKITPEIPFVFVTGTLSVEVAVDTLKRGATDFVLKDNISKLPGVVAEAVNIQEKQKEEGGSDKDLLAYERLFNLSLDLLCITGADGYFKKVNPVFLDTLGYSREELLSRPFIELVHPEDVENTRAEFQKQISGIPSIHFENRFRCKDDSYKWLAWTARPDPERGILYSVARDVTEQKRNEEDLRIRDRAMWSSSNGVIITDPNLASNPIIYVNPAFEKITGYAKEEVLGLNCRILQKGDLEQKGLEIMRMAIREGKECKVIIRNYKKNGDLFYNEIKISPVRDNKNRITHFVGILNDITDRLRSEQILKESYKTIEAHAQELEQFAYITSHNLRAPVANIQGLMEIYESDSLDKDTFQILNKNLRISVETLERVIGDLNSILDIRRNSSRQRKSVNLEEVVREIMSNLTEKIRTADATINYNFTQAPSIYTIEPYIYSIFHNLIENAIKYRKKDKKLVLNISLNIENDQILLSFSDNGMGINLSKNRNDLFGLYKRFHFHVDGKGLGLHMVKQQVDAMRGEIEVESEVNEGTTFHIYLPISQLVPQPYI